VFEAIQDRMRVLQVDVMLARMDLEDGDPNVAESVAVSVLQDARDGSLLQPEVEAMELLGDIAMARGDTAAAIDEYTAALIRVRESTWSAKETDISVRLLDAYLDAGDVESAAPLAGALAVREPDVAVLKARARFAAAHGEMGQAAALLGQAKTLAGAAWDSQSEALLSEYRRQ